jgi:hypothetical protein
MINLGYVALGLGSADAAIRYWDGIDESRHRMLSTEYVVTGVAYQNQHWVQVFDIQSSP